MLESDEIKSLRATAEREKIDNGYVSRLLNLTNLAPDIVEAILDHKLPSEITQFDIVDPPVLWAEQRGRAGH